MTSASSAPSHHHPPWPGDGARDVAAAPVDDLPPAAPPPRPRSGRPGGPGRSPATRSPARWLLAFPALSALVTLAVLAYSSGLVDPTTWATPWSRPGGVGEDVVPDLVLTGYNLLPPLALAALVVVAARRAPRGLSVVVVACVVQTGLVVVSLVSMLLDESSTAALLLLFLPVSMLVLLLSFVGLTALVHRLRSRPRR